LPSIGRAMRLRAGNRDASASAQPSRFAKLTMSVAVVLFLPSGSRFRRNARAYIAAPYVC